MPGVAAVWTTKDQHDCAAIKRQLQLPLSCWTQTSTCHVPAIDVFLFDSSLITTNYAIPTCVFYHHSCQP